MVKLFVISRCLWCDVSPSIKPYMPQSLVFIHSIHSHAVDPRVVVMTRGGSRAGMSHAKGGGGFAHTTTDLGDGQASCYSVHVSILRDRAEDAWPFGANISPRQFARRDVINQPDEVYWEVWSSVCFA